MSKQREAARSEGSPGGRRSLAANHRGTAGTGRRKPDHCTPWDIRAPPLRMTTAMTWTFQRPARAVSVGHSSKRSFHDSLFGLVFRRLKDTLLSKGAWQQVTRIEDLCHSSTLPQMAPPPGRLCGSCPDAASMTTSPTSRRDLATGSGRVTGSVDTAASSWTLSWNMQKPAAPLKPRGCTTRVFTLWFVARNWQTLTLPRDLGGPHLRNPGRLIFSIPLVSPDAVRPWTCVWPPPLQWHLEECCTGGIRSQACALQE